MMMDWLLMAISEKTTTYGLLQPPLFAVKTYSCTYHALLTYY
jgi:hypothetical protein